MTHEDRDYSEIMRSRGYRVTPQRLIVLDAVCAIGGHATMGAIYQRAKELEPSIDQSTIYRALEVLREVGLVVSAETATEGKVYEIAAEKPHHHLLCQKCGAMQQVDHALIKQLFDQIQQQYGFTPADEHLVLHGLCQQCVQHP